MGKIFGNRERLAAVAAENRVSRALILAPHLGRMTSQFRMALYAGIKCVAALKSHRNKISLSVIMRTLRLLIDAYPANNHLTKRSAATNIVAHQHGGNGARGKRCNIDIRPQAEHEACESMGDHENANCTTEAVLLSNFHFLLWPDL